MDTLLSVIERKFGESIAASKSWSTVVDVQSGTVNKGRALNTLRDKYLPRGVRVYACGDYINDIQLLRVADVAACPSNAHEYIRSLCDMCLCSNDEGLIGELVERIDK